MKRDEWKMVSCALVGAYNTNTGREREIEIYIYVYIQIYTHPVHL